MSGYVLFRRQAGGPGEEAKICLVGPDGRIVDDATDIKASWTIHPGDEGEEYRRCIVVVTREERLENVQVVVIEEDEPLPSELGVGMNVTDLIAALTVLERAGRGNDVVKTCDSGRSLPITGYEFGRGDGIVELASDGD